MAAAVAPVAARPEPLEIDEYIIAKVRKHPFARHPCYRLAMRVFEDGLDQIRLIRKISKRSWEKMPPRRREPFVTALCWLFSDSTSYIYDAVSISDLGDVDLNNIRKGVMNYLGFDAEQMRAFLCKEATEVFEALPPRWRKKS